MKIATLLDRKAHPGGGRSSRFPFENYYWEVDEVRNKMNNSSSLKERLSPAFLARMPLYFRKMSHNPPFPSVMHNDLVWNETLAKGKVSAIHQTFTESSN